MTAVSSPQPPRTAWTAQELAASLGVSAKHVYRMCAAGEISHRRLGHRVVIPVDVVRELVGAEAFDLATRLAAIKLA
jgi:excisionase family DNA binding protein